MHGDMVNVNTRVKMKRRPQNILKSKIIKNEIREYKDKNFKQLTHFSPIFHFISMLFENVRKPKVF